MARFDNKVVLVSGGARGQGAAEARLLAAQGAKVVIGDVLDNQGQALAGELGPAASFVRHDVTSEADWARAVEAAQKLGGLHGLVNNAGIYQPAALDLGGRKIRVNSVHPGPIDTDMIAFRTPEQREERMKQVPMHRHGTPEEVAQLVAFLLSDESSYITGAEIAIDGASSA